MQSRPKVVLHALGQGFWRLPFGIFVEKFPVRFLPRLLLVTFGVLLQLPDVRIMIDHARLKSDADLPSGAPGMESMDALEGMSMWTPTMLIGMLLLLVGFLVAAQSLFRGTRPSTGIAGIGVESIEHGRLRPIYWATAAVLTVALVVDVMKPLTLGFVLPGMGQEYDMPLEAVTILPLVALTGTAVGSVVWGLLGDRFGRRSALLLATLLFIATSACGAMPSFEWNLVMCFVMGSSAGGLLPPLVFTLVAELTPRRHRGWVAVTVGSIGGLGGYLAASEAAHLLEPSLTWRALWLIGLPTGLLLVLAPLAPESPLFLLRAGSRGGWTSSIRVSKGRTGGRSAPPAGMIRPVSVVSGCNSERSTSQVASGPTRSAVAESQRPAGTPSATTG
ncbi:MFS transporter [Salinispora arenicola]|uniref:MFS transporter n=1 Tax=Salinispora arenicola TaxID=168697 RepID=UPI0028BE8972|nr:MFS transporter [Salinispora arenicola]